MKPTPRTNTSKQRWILPSILALALVAIGFGFSEFLGTEEAGNPVLDVPQPGMYQGDKPDEGEEQGYERITDGEYARRAAQSPDQARVAQRFTPHAEKAKAAGGVDWHTVGPRPIVDEYWSGNDDASGRVSAIIVDPNDPDIVYCAGAQGGVWKSTDAGVNWTPMSDFLSSLASGALAFHPNNSDVIYYGTGEQHFSGDSFYGDGLFRSDDGGVTWIKLAAKTDVGSYISRIVVDPNNPQIIYLGSNYGFLRSTDAGVTWVALVGTEYCTDIMIDPSTPGEVYCAMRTDGIYRSTTYGTGMVKQSVGMPTSGFRRINFAISESNPQVLYAAFAADNGALHGMYKTINGGDAWFQLTATPEYMGGQGNYDNCITVDPANENIVYAGGNFPFGGAGDYGLIKTIDGGTTWNDVNIGIDGSQPHPDHHIFAWGNDGRLWMGNDGGVWYTTDGGQTYTNCNATLALGQFYTAVIHPSNANFVLGGTQDNGSARFDGVDAWPQVVGGDGGPNAVEWDSPNIYYTTYVRLWYLYKFDNGSYVDQVAGPWDGDRASWCNSPLTVDQNQADTILAGTHRVWRTTDSAGNWTAISGDLTDGSGYLLALAIANGASNTIYSGSSDGKVFVTTDASIWDDRSSGLPPRKIGDIALDPDDWQSAFLCADQSSGGRVFFTDDAGLVWQDVTGDLPDGLRALCLAVDFRPEVPRLYAGTDYGVYFSLDAGVSWAKADAGLPNLAIYDLALDTTNSLLVAGTHGRGMWRAVLDVTAPTVALTAPVGGETWSIDQNVQITWTASDNIAVEAVDILLSRDGGATYPETLASGIANSSSFDWMVTGPISSLCRVQVIATDAATNEAMDASSGDFVVNLPTSAGDAPAAVTALRGASPNPFNPSTNIAFELGSDTRARIEVYSIDGRLVRTLVDESLSAGPHSATWNGRDDAGQAVASGNYLFTLTTADGFRKTGKVLLMK